MGGAPPTNTSPAIRKAFQYCEEIARSHYENFPVVTFFLPSELRPYIAAIYAFARTADDFADEGTDTSVSRLDALEEWQVFLNECYKGNVKHPIFIALHEVVFRKDISKQLFVDLLTAFRQDVITHRYQTYDELLTYCRHSANPIGRLVLAVFEDVDEGHFLLSDRICTALQLANFWQDVSVDCLKDRIYIPLEDMSRFGYTEKDIFALRYDERFVELMKFQVGRTEQMFMEGKPLVKDAVSGLRFELGLTWNGGMKILRKIQQASYDVLTRRPKITTADKCSILLHTMFHTEAYHRKL